jgi:hypothetical protein
MDLLIIFGVPLAIYALVLLIIHLRTLVRSILSVAVLLFKWAVEGGFVGFVAYVAAWIFLFPVMISMCVVGGVALTWIHVSEEREARAIERYRRDLKLPAKKQRMTRRWRAFTRREWKRRGRD